MVRFFRTPRVSRLGALIVSQILFFWSILRITGGKPGTSSSISHSSSQKVLSSSNEIGIPPAYDTTSPPDGDNVCEDVVNELQRRTIEHYQTILKDIRYVSIWGTLDENNKGDAAAAVAQEMLLQKLDIKITNSCIYRNRKCDVKAFNEALVKQKPHSAILIASGDFGETEWQALDATFSYSANLRDIPIRTFPQRYYKDVEQNGKDLVLTSSSPCRSQWLLETYETIKVETKACGEKEFGTITNIVAPDITFMWGSQPEIRKTATKKYDILILERPEDESYWYNRSPEAPSAEGKLDLGGNVGEVSYLKVDWSRINKTTTTTSENHNKMAFSRSKAMDGFDLIASSRFVITDRLHGHLMSLLTGTPHAVMESKNVQNFNFLHNWTKKCNTVRLAENFDAAKDFARQYFEREMDLGRWNRP